MTIGVENFESPKIRTSTLLLSLITSRQCSARVLLMTMADY